ncbi:phospho-sugar mutase [Mycolicibacterium frederiksbergense]|uniref:Phospho-sugar mutase n=1 Tax=Mycolicibacterium frederiksbergense TaxID=117567 RepID=A0A6H0S2E5_9MYCO|nr:phospho-sugar mutase [Mycolicibacterium frederiksbergense]QIV80861.1 phospho-sugar mutase [Mycolicibacterium frederiksbergense]
MTSAQDWITHDPDPVTAAELASCDADEIARRFAHPLTFGTAGLRGPLRGGPDGMNVAVVMRTTWALAQVLKDRCLGGSPVVVGRDTRHGSEDFARSAAEVLAAEGFTVIYLYTPAPTPVLAFAVRHLGAAAGVQITASHNPPADNGYKVFVDGGLQLISPTDREIEAAITRAPHADEIARTPVEPAGADLVAAYLERVATVRRTAGDVRVALTPMHGVGGEFALDALALAGIGDVHVVDAQFAPDPDFPTVAFPNPEEPGATDLLLTLAAEVGAEVAIALDPDADRCAVGVPDGQTHGWRMLTGDETGWLLGDYLLSLLTDPSAALVANTVVSSRMLAAIAAGYGAQHAETLTGFKWLARATAPGAALIYAYEEAIGHCVDPDAVRDKDGISAAVLICDLVTSLRSQGRTLIDALDDLARRHGVHLTSAVSRRVQDAGVAMAALRADPPACLAGIPVHLDDLGQRRGLQRTDALVFTGDGIRVVVRPSGTEPKLKSYIEVRRAPTDDLVTARARAEQLRTELVAAVSMW